MSIADFKLETDRLLATQGILLPGNKESVQSVFILSGGGGSDYEDAYRNGADVFITGELSESSVRAAEELGMALYAAGHYNSEKWGICELGNHLQKKFSIEAEFVDVPNPI